MLNIFHPGAMGDMIYALPSIKAIGKCNLYTKPLSHPRRNRTRKISHDFMKKILELQDCIHEFGYLPDDAQIDYNFNDYRNLARVKTNQHLAKTHMELFNLQWDISKPWLDNIEPKEVPQRIIFHYTKRYHNYATEKELQYGPNPDYPSFYQSLKERGFDLDALKKHKNNVLIIGKSKEKVFIEKMFNEKFAWLDPADAYEFAQIIKGSRLFVGNQSIGLSLAEAMKKPRAYETFDEYDNCRPNSNNGHCFLTEDLIEHYLKSEEDYEKA